MTRTTMTTDRSSRSAIGLTTGIPLWAPLIRAGIVLVDYLLVMVTASGLIPMLGAYMHRQSGVASKGLSLDGAIALWAVPFGFVVVMIAAAELAVMRWLWRAGSRRIEWIRRTRLDEFEVSREITAPPALGTATTSRTTHKKESSRQRGKK